MDRLQAGSEEGDAQMSRAFDDKVPLAVLRDRDLTALEAVVYYLKKEKGFSNTDIARLLNRDDRTVWTVYNRAARKVMAR